MMSQYPAIIFPSDSATDGKIFDCTNRRRKTPRNPVNERDIAAPTSYKCFADDLDPDVYYPDVNQDSCYEFLSGDFYNTAEFVSYLQDSVSSESLSSSSYSSQDSSSCGYNCASLPAAPNNTGIHSPDVTMATVTTEMLGEREPCEGQAFTPSPAVHCRPVPEDTFLSPRIHTEVFQESKPISGLYQDVSINSDATVFMEQPLCQPGVAGHMTKDSRRNIIKKLKRIGKHLHGSSKNRPVDLKTIAIL